MGVKRKVGAVVAVILVVVAAIVVAFVTGVLGAPSAGLEDRGDWGTVTEDRTEVVTTVWVDNPNPVGLTVGDSATVSYELHMNDVTLANGEKTGIDVPAGNNTVQLSTYIRNENIPPWWVAFVRNDETIPVRINASATVGGTVTASADFPTQRETLLNDSTPVITALSNAANGTQGEYTATVSKAQIQERSGFEWSTLVTEDYVGLDDQDATVGYEIREGWAEWGEVTNETTTVRFHLDIYNPGDVPVPATPENLGVDVDMNNVSLFSAQANDTSLRNAEDFSSPEFGDRILEPGQSEEAVYVVEMDNENIDDWFRSHVRQGEQTDIRAEARIVFSASGTEFTLPADGGVAYTCDLQTAILVDDQATSTDCGQVESLSFVGDRFESDGGDDGSEDTLGDGDVGDNLDNTTDVGDGNLPDDGSGDDLPDDGSGDDLPDDGSGDDLPDDGSGDSDGGDDTDGSDSGGDDTESVAQPTAVADADPTSGEAPLEVTFDASESTAPDTEIVSYEWEFDGGALSGEGETVTRVFERAGEYTVRLTVTDDEGNVDTDTITISVESALG